MPGIQESCASADALETRVSLIPVSDRNQKGISHSSTHLIRAQRGNKDSDLRAGARVFFIFKLKPGSDTGFQEGNSGLCGVRLRALP